MEAVQKLQIPTSTHHLLYTCSWEWHQAKTTQSLVRTSSLETLEIQTGETAGFHTVLTQGQELERTPRSVEGKSLAGNLIWASSARLGPSVFSRAAFWTHPPAPGTTVHRRWHEGFSFLAMRQNHLVALPLPGSHLQKFWFSGFGWCLGICYF